MAKKVNRREWTKDDVRELKTLARQKTPVAKIAKSLKRTLGRRWWLVAERCMRPDRAEVTPPTLDDDLSLSPRVEDFAVEQFIA